MTPLRSTAPVEQRSRADLTATVVVIVAVALLVGGTWLFSDARGTSHTEAGAGESVAPLTAPDDPPQALEELWRADSTPSATGEPLVVDGTAVVSDPGEQSRISGRDVTTGTEAWSYERSRELCGVTGNWGRVVAVYRGPKGCGEVTSLSASTGQYQDTRSALAGEDVELFRSLDHVGAVSDDRAELWRSDLVRTVEVGHVEVPVTPDAQPLDGCRFGSALTRTDLLALVTDCDRDDGKATASLQVASPEESDEPELTHEFTVPADALLVGVAQQAAVIYVQGNGTRAVDTDDYDGSRYQVLHTDGHFEQYPADPSPVAGGRSDDHADGPFVPETADLPHHMTWFDGERLVAFGPTGLEPQFTVPALGTGAETGGRLLAPVAEGVAVVNWSNGVVERTIPVDRGDHSGPVTLRVHGDVIVEQRGDEMVALRQPA